MTNNVIGMNIVKRRHELNISQEKLAEASDLSINYISRIERGVSKHVSADTLYKISKSLDRSLTITVALYDRGSYKTEQMISGLVYGETMSSFDKVSWKKRQSYPMITALYLTAGQVVHCGSGKRGFLHAMAVRAASRGSGLITRTSDNNFEPSTIRKFLEAMGANVT